MNHLMAYFVRVWFVIRPIKTQKNWVYPEEVRRENNKLYLKDTGESVTELSSIKMSKSKKNIVDPVNIIKNMVQTQLDFLYCLIVLLKEN